MKGFGSGLDKATDNTYLHVAADIKLLGGQQPQQVFLSLRAEDSSRHLLWFNQLAYYDSRTDRFIATIDFNALPDLINGKYELQLVALDPSAIFDKPADFVWKLGSIEVWYREGASAYDFVNKVESTKYYLKQSIIATFPVKAEQIKNPLVAIVVVSFILFVFYLYVQRQVNHCQANVMRLDFWGGMLVVSLKKS